MKTIDDQKGSALTLKMFEKYFKKDLDEYYVIPIKFVCVHPYSDKCLRCKEFKEFKEYRESQMRALSENKAVELIEKIETLIEDYKNG